MVSFLCAAFARPFEKLQVNSGATNGRGKEYIVLQKRENGFWTDFVILEID
jgi:hypothetical protein